MKIIITPDKAKELHIMAKVTVAHIKESNKEKYSSNIILDIIL